MCLSTIAFPRFQFQQLKYSAPWIFNVKSSLNVISCASPQTLIKQIFKTIYNKKKSLVDKLIPLWKGKILCSHFYLFQSDKLTEGKCSSCYTE